jgi:hypothetical protein
LPPGVVIAVAAAGAGDEQVTKQGVREGSVLSRQPYGRRGNTRRQVPGATLVDVLNRATECAYVATPATTCGYAAVASGKPDAWKCGRHGTRIRSDR